MGANSWRRRLRVAAAVATLIAMLVPIAAAQVTAQDLQAMEARLLNAVHSDAANVTAAVAALRANVTTLRAELHALNATVYNAFATNNATSNQTLMSLLTAMRLTLGSVQANLSKLDLDTLRDHKNIYGSLVEVDNTTKKVRPLLPLIRHNIDTGNLALRGELGEWGTNLTANMASLDAGTAAAVESADHTGGKANYMTVALTIVLGLNLVGLSYFTKRPRWLHRRIEHEERRVNALGRLAAPDCPAPPEMDLKFGLWDKCPHSVRDKCSVQALCKRTAMNASQRSVVEDADVEESRGDATPPSPNGNGHKPTVETLIGEV